MNDYVCVKKFNIKIEAEMAQAKLLAEGIQSVIPDPQKGPLQYSFAAQNPYQTQLMVLKKDLPKAQQILSV